MSPAAMSVCLCSVVGNRTTAFLPTYLPTVPHHTWLSAGLDLSRDRPFRLADLRLKCLQTCLHWVTSPRHVSTPSTTADAHPARHPLPTRVHTARHFALQWRVRPTTPFPARIFTKSDEKTRSALKRQLPFQQCVS
ncbi:hypothetical protein LY76DRAFT_191914 [Colletotrichum caudatum]|nr:hypothetical protein LY76DRAFT_191914 [Colletotrichum caudatum]